MMLRRLPLLLRPLSSTSSLLRKFTPLSNLQASIPAVNNIALPLQKPRPTPPLASQSNSEDLSVEPTLVGAYIKGNNTPLLKHYAERFNFKLTKEGHIYIPKDARSDHVTDFAQMLYDDREYRAAEALNKFVAKTLNEQEKAEVVVQNTRGMRTK